MGFPAVSDRKESACNVGNPLSIPWSGRAPGERERLPTPVEELWTEVLNVVQEAVTRTITKKKKCTVAHLSRCDPKDSHILCKQVHVLCSSRTLCTKTERGLICSCL